MLAVFILGILVGATAVIAFCLYKIRQLATKENKTIEQVKGEFEKASEVIKAKILEKREAVVSVQKRLGEVHEIFKKQYDLQAALDMPSKNAAHSRYKNGLVAELKELEGKKYDILQSILKDGFDPVIGVVNDNGSKEEMKLSEFVAQFDSAGPLREGEMPPAQKNEKPPVEKDEIDEEIDKGRKAGKFFVYSGGKPDTTH